MNLKSVKIQINLFLAAFAIFLFLKEQNLLLLSGFCQAVVFTVLSETLILFLKTRQFKVTSSAVTSGLILGFVLASDSPWWIFLAAAGLTIGLKYLIRFHGKHLLNPAASGIFLTVLLLNTATEWKGAYVWHVLVPAGLYFVYKIRKLELVLGYFFMSLLLFVPQTLSQHASLWDIPGYFNYFFIFIMLVEPKTTPATRWPKILFGAGVALLSFALTERGFRYEPDLFALLVFNLSVPVLNKISNLKFQMVPKGGPS